MQRSLTMEQAGVKAREEFKKERVVNSIPHKRENKKVQASGQTTAFSSKEGK